MNYLILIDSDGTLRNTNGVITNRTKNIINKLTSSGIYVVICTGRSRNHTKNISCLANASSIIISSNGTEIYNKNNNSIINIITIDSNICKKLISFANKNDIRLVLVIDNYEYVTKNIENINQVLLPPDVDKFISSSLVKQCRFTDFNETQLVIIKKYISGIEGISIINECSYKLGFNNSWISVANSTASKGYALKILANFLNIPLSNTIAIGNDYNDISMFKEAGMSIAVANANEDIKSIVDKVILSNDEEGVAQFLEDWYEIKCLK